jgi:hypothetical protein
MNSSSDNQPAFTGHIANTLDALLIFEGAQVISLDSGQLTEHCTSVDGIQHAGEAIYHAHRAGYQSANVET